MCHEEKYGYVKSQKITGEGVGREGVLEEVAFKQKPK